MESNNTNATPQAEVAQEVQPKVNKKTIITISAIVLAIVVIGLIWFLVRTTASNKADEAVGLADTEMYNDSIRLAKYMEAATLGHKSGNRAKLHAAISLYQKGDYEAAIKYLNDASVSSDIVEAGKYTLMGDCYVNLKNYDQALSCYKKAISASDDNPQIIPFVLVKEANIYREQKNYAAEYDAYQTIFNKYPEYATTLPVDIRKYAERARVAAGK